MMNCRETRKWLSPYLDSELEQTKTFEVSEHLRVCPKCAERFEQERRAEGLFREAVNQETMPADVWARISRDVTTPTWFRSLRSPRGLALAAAIALAVIAWRAIPTETAEASPTWLVDRFVSETPSDQAFARAGQDDATILTMLRDALRLDWPLSVEAATHHGHFGFEIVAWKQVTDPSGRPYVEIRLNCCNQPMLFAFAKADDTGSTGLDGMLVSDNRWREKYADLNVDVRRVGSIVAVGVSRHSIEGMLGALRAISG